MQILQICKTVEDSSLLSFDIISDRFNNQEIGRIESGSDPDMLLKKVISLFDKYQIINTVQIICIDGLAVYNYLQKMLSLDRLYCVMIVPSLLYLSRNYPTFELAFEQWNSSNDSMLLYSIGNLFTVQKAFNLLRLVEEVISWIQGFSPANDLERIILLDVWFQKNIQYIMNRKTRALGDVYICEAITSRCKPSDVLEGHYGVCEDIAFTATMIMNHPEMSVNCRQIGYIDKTKDFNHSWNIIQLNKHDYFTDFTHNITRNPHRLDNALKATQYCYDNLLIGRNYAAEKYGFSDSIINSESIALENLDRNTIEKAIKSLVQKGLELNWGDKVVLESYKEGVESDH